MEDHAVLGRPIYGTGLHQAKAATLKEICKVLREPKVVWGPPEGQCLFHMPALFQQAGFLVGSQAQESNLKELI